MQPAEACFGIRSSIQFVLLGFLPKECKLVHHLELRFHFRMDIRQLLSLYRGRKMAKLPYSGSANTFIIEP